MHNRREYGFVWGRVEIPECSLQIFAERTILEPIDLLAPCIFTLISCFVGVRVESCGIPLMSQLYSYIMVNNTLKTQLLDTISKMFCLLSCCLSFFHDLDFERYTIF
jgi:hypothetical protein